MSKSCPSPRLSSWQPSRAIGSFQHRSRGVLSKRRLRNGALSDQSPGNPFFFSASVQTDWVSLSLSLSSRVHALVLQEIIAARKRLSASARERCISSVSAPAPDVDSVKTRTFLVRMQRQHVSLQVLRARKALRAAGHRAHMGALPALGHAPSAALLHQMRDGHRRRDARGAGRLYWQQCRFRSRCCCCRWRRRRRFRHGVVLLVRACVRRLAFPAQTRRYAS